MATKSAVRDGAARSVVSVTDESIVVRIPRPVGGGQSARAAKLVFAARADSFRGMVLWHQYEAVFSLVSERVATAVSAGANTAFTRLYDPMCQVAASYAVAAGVGQFSAERFVEAAQACFERVPAVGRLLRDGVITPAWFQRVVEQVSLVDDPAVLAFIDGEIAHRLAGMGALSAKRVEGAVAAIVAEHDRDAVMLTREQAKASKKFVVTPLNEDMSQVVVTTSTEDAMLVDDALDAVIAGVCEFDRRTRSQLRTDAAVAAMCGVPFVCKCGRDECGARLAPEQIAQRCARVVLHVIAREETLDGTSQTPAVLDGFGPISAEHARELAARDDAVRRELHLEGLVGQMAQPGDAYRPTAALDTAVRALHGTCSWVGCARPAWKCDLDHVTEFNHADPAAGGATCVCNLNPKCRFHHGLKTHAQGWLDDQVVDANGVFWTEITTPEGLTVRQQAANGWLLPELGLIPCTHGAATRPGAGSVGDGPERSRTRLQAKHDYRMRRRAENRRAREAAEAVAAAERAVREAADGEPPF